MKESTEQSPLLKKDEPPIDVRSEFLQLVSMALQVSLSTFARIALIAIDSAFLGHLGTKELAASSLAAIWTEVPFNSAWAGATALITLCGQAWGAKNTELVGVWLQMGLVVMTVLAVPVIIWHWCVGVVLELSTDDVEVVRLGERFARIISFTVWPALMYACVRHYFQSMGIMTPTTVVGVISIGVAASANYTLIFGAFGWSGLGFDGSPLASVIASWFQPIALISYCILYKKMHRRAWGGWSWESLTADRLKTYLKITAPISANSFVTTVSNSAMALIAARMGSDIIAANAVITGLWNLLWALFWGFGCATQVRVANHLGANCPNAAMQLARMGLICSVACVLLLGLATLCLYRRVYMVYTSDDNLLNLCVLVQPIFVTAFIIESIEITISSILTAMGEVNITARTGTITTWCVELPLAYVGCVHLGLGFPMLWYSIVAMEVCKMAVYGFALARVDWKFMAQRAVETMEMAGETEQEALAESLNAAIGEAANTPTTHVATLHSPVASLITPTSRSKLWEHADEPQLHHDASAHV